MLSLPCREHTVLFSRQIDAPLSRGESVGLRIHILYCKGCRRFRSHLRHMRSLGRSLAGQIEQTSGLPADVRQRLIARVADQARKK